MKKYFYIFLLIEVSFGAIIIEPESQIQNSIYYDSLYGKSYYQISDSNTIFNLDSIYQRPLKLSLFLNYEWCSDYLIQILYLHKNVFRYEHENYRKIENRLLRQLK